MAPQAPAPVTTEAPPGEEPATPEANNQAILTEVNTPVEDEIPTPGKVPNVLAADEMPAKPVEVEVPTMSEEDENPLTTIKVPPAADVDEKLVEEASDMPKPKLDVIRVRSSSGNTVLVKREKPKKLMKDGLTGVVPVETSSVLYTGLTLASLSRKKCSNEEEIPEEIRLAEDDDDDVVNDDALDTPNKRKQNNVKSPATTAENNNTAMPDAHSEVKAPAAVPAEASQCSSRGRPGPVFS